VWAVLEEAFTCLLVNAAHVKQVPGRKSDMLDCGWIAQLLEHGLLRGSFVPPAPVRELRDLTRYRKSLIEERTREANRLHKLLEDTGIKLASVATDILGVSGRAMLEALVQGTTDPARLADLARGKLGAKLPALRQALAGQFRPHHAFLVSQLLAHLDYLDEAIDTLSARLTEVMAPFTAELGHLDSIPGVAQRTAEVLIAELGVDMTQFPSAGHAASLGGALSGQQRECAEAQIGADPQRESVAPGGADGSRPRGDPDRQRTGRPVPSPHAPRPQESRGRCGTQHSGDRLSSPEPADHVSGVGGGLLRPPPRREGDSSSAWATA
jgi:hypothetical protein